MSYCDKCDSHDVSFIIYNDGVECSNCGFDLTTNIEIDSAFSNLKAIRLAKRDGWKTYPRFIDVKPIDVALKEAENECTRLGIIIRQQT